MNRRALVSSVGLGILAPSLPAGAQQAGKVPRVGVLLGAASGPSHPIEGFRQGLRDLGYVDGENIAIDYRWAEGNYDRFAEFAADLAGRKVDLIVAAVSAAALAARNATKTIPIVPVLVYDPVSLGLVTSFARPGGNVTGLTSVAGSEIYAKQLELLKAAVPKAFRVAVLANPVNPTSAVQVKETETAARSLGVRRQVLWARGPDDFGSAFAAMTRERAGALLVVADPMFYRHRAQIADLAARHRLPAMYGLKEHAQEGGLLARPLAAKAQRSEKVYRIGFLSPSGCPILPEILAPFREGLCKLGYVERQNILIECRGAPTAAHRLPGLAAELVRLNVDVLVAQGTAAVLAAKQATKTIPIVMVNVGDPVRSGLVTTLARPGGNITGLSALAPDIVPQALEFLKEAAPSVSRVAVWIDPTNPGLVLADAQLDGPARTLGVMPERVDVRAAADLGAAFASTLKQRAEALFVYPLPIPLRDFRRIAEFALENRLPTIVLFPQIAREGVLISYGPDQAEQYLRVGTYIDKILKGAEATDLPVEKPAKFELAINLKTAKALGLTISPLLLLRADEVIQ